MKLQFIQPWRAISALPTSSSQYIVLNSPLHGHPASPSLPLNLTLGGLNTHTAALGPVPRVRMAMRQHMVQSDMYSYYYTAHTRARSTGTAAPFQCYQTELSATADNGSCSTCVLRCLQDITETRPKSQVGTFQNMMTAYQPCWYISTTWIWGLGSSSAGQWTGGIETSTTWALAPSLSPSTYEVQSGVQFELPM